MLLRPAIRRSLLAATRSQNVLGGIASWNKYLMQVKLVAALRLRVSTYCTLLGKRCAVSCALGLRASELFVCGVEHFGLALYTEACGSSRLLLNGTRLHVTIQQRGTAIDKI